MTDKEAIKLALLLAIEWERSIIGSNPGQAEVDRCKAHINAFKRVLDRRYGGARIPQPTGGKRISLMEALNLPPQKFDPEKAKKA